MTETIQMHIRSTTACQVDYPLIIAKRTGNDNSDVERRSIASMALSRARSLTRKDKRAGHSAAAIHDTFPDVHGFGMKAPITQETPKKLRSKIDENARNGHITLPLAQNPLERDRLLGLRQNAKKPEYRASTPSLCHCLQLNCRCQKITFPAFSNYDGDIRRSTHILGVIP